MKEKLIALCEFLIILCLYLVLLDIGTNIKNVNIKLDKLIDLNTPQAVKVIPPEHILEDNLL